VLAGIAAVCSHAKFKLLFNDGHADAADIPFADILAGHGGIEETDMLRLNWILRLVCSCNRPGVHAEANWRNITGPVRRRDEPENERVIGNTCRTVHVHNEGEN
jgi:hypothetical protein